MGKCIPRCHFEDYNSTSMQHCKTEALADLTSLEETLHHCLEWSDFSLLQSLLVFVETQSWMKWSSGEEDGDVSMLEVKRDLEHIFGSFHQLLESQKINLLTLQDEIEDFVLETHQNHRQNESSNYYLG